MPDVVLPVLNEAGALPWVLERMPSGYRPIVVDNCSSDGSGALAASLGATVISESLSGFGAACYAGLCLATSETVCFMDCDGSLDPKHLPMVADLVVAGTADLVLGARAALPGAWPWHARMANRALAIELRRRTGVRLTDLGPMRAARRQALIELDLKDRRFGWPLEMVLKAAAAGWQIREIPVPYAPRRSGKSKVTGTLKGTVRTIADMGSLLR
ncbi:MAG: glycosyltransferase family 2 protein [Actinomycetota bacterium]